MTDTASGVSVQNKRGEWVPAIPLPYYLRGHHRVKCECGHRFRTERRYREHYALDHILGLD